MALSGNTRKLSLADCVHEVEVLSPREGFEAIERRAADAARTCRFTPGRREGIPVPTWTYLDVDFGTVLPEGLPWK